MNGDQTTHLQALIDRMRTGDEAARNELIERSYDRLRKLAGAILHRSFPRLQNLVDTGDVLHAMLLRLVSALKDHRPQTVQEYFTFSAVLIRNVLLDRVRYHDRHPDEAGRGHAQGEESDLLAEPQDSGIDPSRLVEWREFHRAVEGLPPEERQIADLLIYQALNQREAADLLGTNQTDVHRRWVVVRIKLAPYLLE